MSLGLNVGLVRQPIGDYAFTKPAVSDLQLNLFKLVDKPSCILALQYYCFLCIIKFELLDVVN